MLNKYTNLFRFYVRKSLFLLKKWPTISRRSICTFCTRSPPPYHGQYISKEFVHYNKTRKRIKSYYHPISSKFCIHEQKTLSLVKKKKEVFTFKVECCFCSRKCSWRTEFYSRVDISKIEFNLTNALFRSSIKLFA